MTTPQNTKKKVVLFSGDVLSIMFSIYISGKIRLPEVNVFEYYTGAVTFVILIYISSFYVFDIYNTSNRLKSSAYLTRFLIAVGAGTFLVAMVFYFFPRWRFGRGIFLINMFFVSLTTYAWRLILQKLLVFHEVPKRIAIVGAGYAGETIYEVLKENNNFIVKGFLDDDPQKLDKKIGSHSILGYSDLLTRMADDGEVDAVVMTVHREKTPGLLRTLIRAKMQGVEIYNMASLFEELTGKLPVLNLSEGWMAYTPFHGIRKSLYTLHIKRLIDVGLSCIGLILSLPVSLIASTAIRLDSKGPVIFRQKRVGLDGKEFELLKFRSMRVDSEENGPLWASENDPRITMVGKVIRKMRVDEIPQMWNVLKGDMSFIGPRPERPEFVGHLEEDIPFYFFRHAVKPGITGWAQVNFRYGASKEDSIEKLQYDLFYIKNLSIFLDFLIILKTIKVVLFGKGAR